MRLQAGRIGLPPAEDQEPPLDHIKTTCQRRQNLREALNSRAEIRESRGIIQKTTAPK